MFSSILKRILKLYKSIVPVMLRTRIRSFVNKVAIYTSVFRNKVILNRLKGKDNYKVAVFLKIWDGWKLESVYKALEKHPGFTPTIVICPFVDKGQEFLETELNKNISYCDSKSYRYFVAYDRELKDVIDIKPILNPDIVFFDGPNKHSSNKLFIGHFLDTLTCYFHYSFRHCTYYDYEYDNAIANLSWCSFYETEIHKELAQKYATNKGKNVVVLGYPFFDYRLDQKIVSIKNERKLIIWAPHWTIKGFQDSPLDWSCFLEYEEFILTLAKKYQDKVEFVLKPHPLLESILKKDILWGVENTNSYFDKWNSIENCSITRGDYKELFLKSDAMIHDCGSFMTEYLIQNKPLAYTVSEAPLENRFSKYGEIVFNAHQLVKSKKDFEDFVLSVINDIDPLKGKREDVITKFNFNNKESVADKIVNYIDNQLK